MANVLVVYYSRKGENYTPQGVKFLEKGNTEWAAEYIQEELAADIFEIETIIPYPSNYKECCMEAVAEAKAKARPEIKEFVADISGYDTVFVCYPCWCGTAPMCVFTFLEHYNLVGKKIIPLCTNEGSGLANSKSDLEKSCPGAIIMSGLSIRGHKVRSEKEKIVKWAKENQ